MTPLTDNIGFLLSRASGLVIRSTNEALGAEGLRVRQYSVLVLACDTRDGISQRGLADELGLDPSQVVALVDELSEAGLVERRPSSSDRRAKLIAATEPGRRLRSRADRAADTGTQAQLQALAVDEQATLRALLQRVVDGKGAPMPDTAR